eukprot:4981976-Prymnesium_polylepis.2
MLHQEAEADPRGEEPIEHILRHRVAQRIARCVRRARAAGVALACARDREAEHDRDGAVALQVGCEQSGETLIVGLVGQRRQARHLIDIRAVPCDDGPHLLRVREPKGQRAELNDACERGRSSR